MEKKKYTVNELIHNQSFRRLIDSTASRDEVDDWDSWIEECLRNRRVAREAKAEIMGFEFKYPPQTDEDKEWQRLYSTTVEQEYSKSKKNPKKNKSLRWIYRVAAIIILAGVVGMGSYVFSEKGKERTKVDQITERRTIATQSGERKTIKFSNGSTITMNSNATIRYSVGTLGKNTIDVDLKGEAYFDAQSDPKQKEPVFAVHTPEGIIRDIGTQFVVTVQEGRSRVVLQKGQVEVDPKEGTDDSSKAITIQTGELVEFNRSKVLNKKTVNATFYTSWATGSMEFNHTTIQEFAGFVEQRFDMQVQVLDPRLAGIQIDGGIYYKSLDELVRSVSEVAKVPVYQSADQKTIFIGRKFEK